MLLLAIIKDIAVQISVACFHNRQLWEKSIYYHFIAWVLGAPLLVGSFIWAVLCFSNNEHYLDGKEGETMYDWTKSTFNLIFFGFMYMFLHVFPLSCVY